ncbi:MAG: hypothetical protein V1798_00210 [Pseudomonadota bacterium]
MSEQSGSYRYERVNVRPGYVTIEKGRFGGKLRAFFSEGPSPAREEYREGNEEWRHVADAQSVRFDLKDTRTGEIIKLDELLGLLYYAGAKPDSDLYRLGELAQERNIHVYVAIPCDMGTKDRENLPLQKLSALNFAFNERLKTREKMILILPDYFGLYQDLTYGEIMIDFNLTSVEAK